MRWQGFPVIASVAFLRFKALRSARLALGAFNVVIGPNGSGKTSLIEAIMRLRGLSQLAARFPQGSATKAEGPEIVFGFEQPFSGVEVRLACVSDVACDLLEVTATDPSLWEQLRPQLSGIRGYLLDHYALAEASPREDSASLRSNGSNLSAVLAARKRAAPEAFMAMEVEFVRLFPEFSAIGFDSEGGDRVGLSLALAGGAGSVGGADVSQGTLYALALLTLSFDPEPPPVVCIEEPDRGVHPRLLREVRDALYRLSYPASFGLERRPVQVIATTQSPYLVDQFRDHPEEVVISQKEGTAAHFVRLNDLANVEELLREGALGDLWYSGILGGVPDGR